jgi:hypothetical protein
MNAMTMPGFTAEASLRNKATSATNGGHRRGRSVAAQGGTVVPAIPFCGNCDEILDMCAETGGRPWALCRACAIGDCYSGVENPIPPYPWGWGSAPRPWEWL